MKFAVITDVHGNAPALKAVLEEIDGRHDIDHIYCVGDMIAIGPDSNEVLDRLFSRHDVSMITGNHDEAVLALCKGEAHPLSHCHVKKHHQWIADRMDSKFIDKLASLPRSIQQDIMGHSILFTHYHIASEKIDVPISEDPFSIIVEPSAANMKTLFNTNNADLICFGHHHPVHLFKSDETIYLNPGSLGCSATPFAKYSIVSVDVKGIHVELCEAPYDNREFLHSYEPLKVPEREFILKVFHGNQLN